MWTDAYGSTSFAGGKGSTAYGNYSFAFGGHDGSNTGAITKGDCSFAFGDGSVANAADMFVVGRYNELDDTVSDYEARSIGISEWLTFTADELVCVYDGSYDQCESNKIVLDPDHIMDGVSVESFNVGVYESRPGYIVVDKADTGTNIVATQLYNIAGCRTKTDADGNVISYELLGQVIAPEQRIATRGQYSFVVGNGTGMQRSNAFSVTHNGVGRFKNAVYAQNKILATQEYVDNKFAEPFDGMILKSSTVGSTKQFRITVDDTGTLSAVEVTP